MESRRGPYSKTAARRREILDAALTVFGRSGFRSGSIREIADLVNISQAGLLHHFRNKSELLIAVLQHRDEVQLAGFPSGGPETLVALVEVAEFNVRHRGMTELHCVLSAEATAADHPAHGYFTERYERLRRLLHSALSKLQASGALLPGFDAAVATRSILALMDGLQVQWLLDPKSVDMPGDLRAFLRQFVSDEVWDAAAAARRSAAV